MATKRAVQHPVPHSSGAMGDRIFLPLVPCDTDTRVAAPMMPPARGDIVAQVAFIGDSVMKPHTGPHAFGLIAVPLLDRPVPNSAEKRLAIDNFQPVTRKTRTAFLAFALIAAAVSFVAVPVSYAIHRHLHP